MSASSKSQHCDCYSNRKDKLLDVVQNVVLRILRLFFHHHLSDRKTPKQTRQNEVTSTQPALHPCSLKGPHERQLKVTQNICTCYPVRKKKSLDVVQKVVVRMLRLFFPSPPTRWENTKRDATERSDIHSTCLPRRFVERAL